MKDNRFSVLRRTDRNILKKADITTDDLSKLLGVSTGTISKLENECRKGEVPNTTAAVLQAYRKHFGCSYEYLMGETEQESPKYLSVATSLPFKMLRTEDIDNLAYVFSDPQYGHVYASLLSALLSKPNKLKELLSSLLPSLREIGFIHENSDIAKNNKELAIRPIRYTYTNMFAEQIEEHFIPQMHNVFAQYDEIQAQEHITNEQSLAALDTDCPILTTEECEPTLSNPIVSNLKVTIISEENSQQ